MKKTILNAVILMTGIIGHAQSTTVGEVTVGLQSPESVTACGKYLYVSNMGSKIDPTAKDGDGYISRLSRKDGKVIDEKFISGLNSPKGIKIIHGKILVADVDHVIAYCIKDKKKVWEADLSKEGVTYANDISIRSCGSVFVSATDKDAIYKVCKKGTVKKLAVKGSIDGANGILRAGCFRLYVANYGQLSNPNGTFGYISLCSKKYKACGNGGVYDGIQKVGSRIVVTDWVTRGETKDKGRLLVYRPCKKTTTEITVGKPLSGPSDIYSDCKYKTLWIPCMLDNKLVSVPYKMIKAKK